MSASDTTRLLWVGREPSRRGPKPVLTLSAITEAGIRIADAQGLAAVTMQSVAEALGFTKMSLYRHIDSKDELLAVMTEHAYREPPRFPAHAAWRRRLTLWVEQLGELWQRHSWLPAASAGHRTMGPLEIGWIEGVLAALQELRLDPSERSEAAFLLSGYARNMHSLDSAGTHPWNEPVHRQLLADHAQDFPATSSAMRVVEGADSQRGFGLTVILDGLQSIHDRRSEERTPPSSGPTDFPRRAADLGR